MTTSQILQHLYSLDTSSPETSRLLGDLIRLDEEENYLSGLQGSELTRLVDFLDDAISAIPTTDEASWQWLHKLQAICGDHATLPSSYIISHGLVRVGDHPIASGGSADVWEGTHGDRRVCVKVLRISVNDGQSLAKSFVREAIIWRRLRHPNIVPLIGVTIEPLQIVSKWIPNGTLTKYVKKDPGVDRIGLLLDVAEGLNYLHANYTIHGDLKGPNILVDHNGNALLTDFGLALIVSGMHSIPVTKSRGYTAGWAAPEILEGANEITREADIFAFGMVVTEVFTGRYPFSDSNTPSIVLKITGGERPARPQEAQGLGLTDPLWDMTVRCWARDPDHRPTVAELVGLLRECYRVRASNPPPPSSSQQAAGNTGGGTNNPSIPSMSTDGEPTSAKSPGRSQHFCQPNLQICETPADPSPMPNISHHGVSRSSRNPFRKPPLVEPYAAPTSGKVPTPDVRPESSGFGVAERRIDEIAEELAHGNPMSRGKATIELRKLCGHHSIIPTSYKLEGVVKQGELPQYRHPTGVTEVWKGRYNGGVVALKVLRVPLDDPLMRGIKSRFCKEVVVMMQLKHENILPFYGVSTTVADLCLVFPWYRNGNIMDYLKGRPDANRFALLSGASSGLCFLHRSRLVHGALRPSHILIDDDGTARLAAGGRSSIVAVPDTSIASHSQSGLDGDVHRYRYSAPEIQWRDEHTTDKILITKESDVYGMAMIAYEVLTGNVPYFGYSDTHAFLKIQAGEIPQRPFDGITDLVWEFLEQCWSNNPTKRPSTVQVHDSFSDFRVLPQVTQIPEGLLAMEELPGKLKLQVQSIRISLGKPRPQRFYVKFTYGNKDHTTSSTTTVAGSEYAWDNLETWLIETNERHHGQFVSIEVFRRTTYWRIKVCATGKFSLRNNVNKDIPVKLEAPRSTGPAVLRVLLIKMF